MIGPMDQRLLFQQRGGFRVRAGRKASKDSGMSHQGRPEVKRANPLLITIKVRKGIPSLRGRFTGTLLALVMEEGSVRFGCRMVEYSIQTNHLHMIVEAPGNDAVSRFMKGMTSRIVHFLRSRFGIIGVVFPDRYHRVDLKSMRQVYNAIRYVLCNANKHGAHFFGLLDPLSSSRWFDGWRGYKAPPESKFRGVQATNYKILNCVSIYGEMDPAYSGPR